jgi:Co/Zn/Cd efflux system component
VLADTLGSVAVIVSSILIKYFGCYVAEPVCCFLISVLILGSAVPFTQQTGRVLSQGLHKTQYYTDATHIFDQYALTIINLRIWEEAKGKHYLSAKVLGSTTVSQNRQVMGELQAKCKLSAD